MHLAGGKRASGERRWRISQGVRVLPEGIVGATRRICGRYRAGTGVHVGGCDHAPAGSGGALRGDAAAPLTACVLCRAN
jgi:hypothetical protein